MKGSIRDGTRKISTLGLAAFAAGINFSELLPRPDRFDARWTGALFLGVALLAVSAYVRLWQDITLAATAGRAEPGAGGPQP